MNRTIRRLKSIGHLHDKTHILLDYEDSTGKSPTETPVHSDSGAFASQLDRLFGLPGDAATLRKLAQRAINIALTNEFYCIEDYLSDIIDDLERRTYYSLEADGEPPLRGLHESENAAKLRLISRAWLVPEKIVAIETSLREAALAWRDLVSEEELGRFERTLARVFAQLSATESRFLIGELRQFITRWASDPGQRERTPHPSRAAGRVLAALLGEEHSSGTFQLRPRVAGLPLRLSTVHPADRPPFLGMAVGRLIVEPSPESPWTTAEPRS